VRLVWSRLATAELREVRRYSVERWGTLVAVTYLSDLRDAAKQVARDPRHARPLRDGWHIRRVRSHYLVVTIDREADTLTIARVLHVARNLDRHLP